MQYLVVVLSPVPLRNFVGLSKEIGKCIGGWGGGGGSFSFLNGTQLYDPDDDDKDSEKGNGTAETKAELATTSLAQWSRRPSPWPSGQGVRLESGRPGFDSAFVVDLLSGRVTFIIHG